MGVLLIVLLELFHDGRLLAVPETALIRADKGHVPNIVLSEVFVKMTVLQDLLDVRLRICYLRVLVVYDRYNVLKPQTSQLLLFPQLGLTLMYDCL